ncbi:MAG: hypothetical protein ACOYKD_06155 [Anaerolineaceae bacterium]|jgi:hypothetical protein
MNLNTLLQCMNVAPVMVFFAGLVGFFGAIQLGPREVPKTDPLTKRFGLTFVVMALGLFMSLFAKDTFSVVFGIITVIAGIGLYGMLTSQARKLYPAITDTEWVQLKKEERVARYQARKARREGRQRDPQVPEQQEDNKEV